LPPGAPSHAPADLIEAVLATDTPVWLDASGSALARALDARPTGIKINTEEAGTLLGRTLHYLDDVYDAARAIRQLGIASVIITLGARGAVLSGPTGELHLRAPATQAVSAVGSGDAFLAGWLVAQARQKPDQIALAWAIAAGAANTLIPGGGIFARADFDDLLAELQ
jgi:1-phosphofructokinase